MRWTLVRRSIRQARRSRFRSRTISPSAGERRIIRGAQATLIALFCGVALGCTPATGAPAASSRSEPIAAAQEWVSLLDREHPLVGRIWDVRGARFVEQASFLDAVRGARFVALGEQHDNADHHRLEALLIETASAARRPSIVFEMIDVDEQPAVDSAVAAHPGDPDAIGVAVDWAHSGWPAWPLYRPVFAAVARLRLPVLGAGLDRELARKIAHEGVAALPADLVRRFALDAPLDAETSRALRDEMRDAHCGMLPESMLDPMALIQRARDAELAAKLASSDPSNGGVVVAGNGHVRSDRGVPRAFSRATNGTVLAVALVEVRPEWTKAPEYAGAFDSRDLPFDYVWFTPRASDEDHCAELGRGK